MTLIARSVSDLRPGYFAEVFDVGAADLETVEVEPIGTGQVASTFRAKLGWRDRSSRLPARVIVKLAAEEIDGRDPARRTATYRREVGFYQVFGSAGNLPIPLCFHADADLEGSFTIVMAESPGLAGNQLVGCSAGVAQSIIDAAAVIHSTTWEFASSNPELEWLSSGEIHAAEIARRNERYGLLLPGFIDRYRERLTARHISVAEQLAGNLERVEQGLRLRRCIIHSDYRLDNMIIDSSGSRSSVTIIDWQTVGLGSGAVDVAYAIGSGLTTDSRRLHEASLVTRYVEHLHQAHVDAETDDVWHDYRLGSSSGLVMAVIASQVVRRTQRGDEMFAVMAERHAAQMLDLEFFDELERIT